MENNNSNIHGFDVRRSYAESPQQAMYGYPPPPPAVAGIGPGYARQHPMAVVPSPSAPAPVYNVQHQYQASSNPYANTPIMQVQQPQYSQFSQQTSSFQGQQYSNTPQPQMRMHHQPQQFIHQQPLQAYQLDGSAPTQPSPSPVMRQSQGNAYMSQQQPTQQQNADHSTPARPRPQSRPQSQSKPEPQVHNHSRTPSQPNPQTKPQVQVQMTPSQSQPRSSPHVQAYSRTPSQSQNPIKQPPQPQQRPTPQGRTPQVVIETRRPHPQGRTTTVKSQAALTPSRELPVDYQVLLLGLADQYINKAHGMSAFLARNPQDADLDEYYSLISAGLGCMESVLKNWKFPDPKVEARLQLRYANLLLEETENDGELQDLLIKGMALCERSRLTDIKYSMKHLQIRAYFRTKPTAAFRMIDQMIEITETYAQFAWMYVFRFLRVSLMLQPRRSDFIAVLQQLRRISTLAERQRQTPILATSSAIEALVHLRSGSIDSVELSQRALAAARTHQLDPAVMAIPQLKALLDCLDLCCDMIDTKPEQQVVKMRVMQKAMDDGKRSAAWSSDGSFCVPTRESAPEDVSLDTCGIMVKDALGQRAITFQWIRRSELFALGYMFSSLASINKNVQDGKSERYAVEGVKVTQDDFNPENERKIQSLKAVSSHLDRRAFYHQLTLQQLVFAKCDRSDWQGASEVLATLSEDVDTRAVDRDDFIRVMTLYLTGVVKQATGDLQGALENFQSPALTLQSGPRLPQSCHDLRLLSTLNTILILRPRPECRGEVDRLMELVEPLCSRHSNSSFQSALNIIRASSTANLPILKMKNLLSLSANTAKKQINQQLLCITINLMTSTFFVDIMGDKAEMSAGVGKTLAERTRSPLWQAVANQMFANTLDFGGKRQEASQARAEAAKAMLLVPKRVQENFEV